MARRRKSLSQRVSHPPRLWAEPQGLEGKRHLQWTQERSKHRSGQDVYILLSSLGVGGVDQTSSELVTKGNVYLAIWVGPTLRLGGYIPILGDRKWSHVSSFLDVLTWSGMFFVLCFHCCLVPITCLVSHVNPRKRWSPAALRVSVYTCTDVSVVCFPRWAPLFA